MTFKDQIIEDQAIFFNEDEFAISVDYRRPPGDDTTKRIPAIFEYSADDEHPGADDFGTVAVLRILAQGENGIETVIKGDEIIVDPDAVDAQTWRITYAKKSEQGLEWICNISKLR